MAAALEAGVALLGLGPWRICGRDTALPLGPQRPRLTHIYREQRMEPRLVFWAAEGNALPGVTSHPPSPREEASSHCETLPTLEFRLYWGSCEI